MKRILSGAAGVLAAAMLTTAVVAQTTPQPQSSTAATQAEQQVIILGCVQREEDYRRAQNKGGGGVAGTGIGVGNEYVLTNASMKTQGLAGAAKADMAYELTGANEVKAGDFVGKRVEIAGKLKPAETAAGRPTGGATAGRPPEGVDVASKDLQLRELEVTSVTAATGQCTP